MVVWGAVSAGYPAEAYNYIEERIDINKYIVQKNISPSCVWATNRNMIGNGIESGDLIVIDEKKTPHKDSIILFEFEDGFTLDRFVKYPDRVELISINPDISPRFIYEGQDLIRKGVVTHVIKKFSVYNTSYGGYPDDADHYIKRGMDFNQYLIDWWETTFFLWAGGDSMIGDGIEKGDLLIVDRLKEENKDSILVFYIDQKYTLKRIRFHEEYNELISSNPKMEPIRVNKGEEINRWAVLTGVVKKYK